MLLEFEVNKEVSFWYEIDLSDYEDVIWRYLKECLRDYPEAYASSVCPGGLSDFVRVWINNRSVEDVIDFAIEAVKAIVNDYEDRGSDYAQDERFSALTETVANLLQVMSNSGASVC